MTVGRGDDAIQPDTKDWTWVLERPCPDCGFDASTVGYAEVAEVVRRDADQWSGRLAAPDAAARPRPSTWSVLEYGCHVRDVHRVFETRVTLMLTEDDPVFPNWDQDATAVADDYASQEPAVVARDLASAAHRVADVYASVRDGLWSRRGLRSNGSEFTVATIAVYHLHDVVHHAWDVGPGRH
ncbi:DinB family protein [Mycolicibacterium sediminis]|uniref:Methyltransferase type 12 n=1 Tax=Mycolicibacterium sediminis TaxID=1286180 RepID=A0A7I7QTQ5_9MYCO|nr:DinB family protein [Mycolicibacterium sediminis]BBY29615.1 methyltransferase type 12 [Mycolicibacterium sediminis]